MADYKDIISGTINSVVKKVKDVAENTNVRGMAQNGANRAKAYGRIAKLSFELNGDNEELKRVYTEIGRLCYEQTKDAPEGFFAPLFAQAAEITARIAAKEEEISELKAAGTSAGKDDQDIDVEIGEFEDIVSATEDEGAGKED